MFYFNIFLTRMFIAFEFPIRIHMKKCATNYKVL